MKIEAKLCWVLGGIMIFGYIIIAWFLNTSWVFWGLEPEWWVTVLPCLFFTFATVFMFIFAYKTYENPVEG